MTFETNTENIGQQQPKAEPTTPPKRSWQQDGTQPTSIILRHTSAILSYEDDARLASVWSDPAAQPAVQVLANWAASQDVQSGSRAECIEHTVTLTALALRQCTTKIEQQGTIKTLAPLYEQRLRLTRSELSIIWGASRAKALQFPDPQHQALVDGMAVRTAYDFHRLSRDMQKRVLHTCVQNGRKTITRSMVTDTRRMVKPWSELRPAEESEKFVRTNSSHLSNCPPTLAEPSPNQEDSIIAAGHRAKSADLEFRQNQMSAHPAAAESEKFVRTNSQGHPTIRDLNDSELQALGLTATWRRIEHIGAGRISALLDRPEDLQRSLAEIDRIAAGWRKYVNKLLGEPSDKPSGEGDERSGGQG
jgi:hypothetical protein